MVEGPSSGDALGLRVVVLLQQRPLELHHLLLLLLVHPLKLLRHCLVPHLFGTYTIYM